jgi:glutamyl-tRNA reductase
VDLTRRIFGDLKGRKAALLGLGEMGQLVAKQLGGEGARLLALGRNPEKTAALAQTLGASPRSVDQLDATLLEVDVLVAMTSSHGFVVERDQVARLVKQRRGRSLFLVDLSVPRNIDPRINELEDVFLYNIDDLSQIVHDTKSNRRGEADRAEQIVLEETRNFERAASAEQVTPLIVAMRRRLANAMRGELEKSCRTKLQHLSKQDQESLEKMQDAALNKILHGLSTRLREIASNPNEAAQLDQHVSTLTELFGLDSEDPMPGRGDTLPPRARTDRPSRSPAGPAEVRASARAREVQ